MKSGGKSLSSHLNNMQVSIPLEDGSNKSGRSKSVQRGASVNVEETSSLLLDGIDPFNKGQKFGTGLKAATTSRGSNVSSKFGCTAPSSFDRSFEGSGSIYPNPDNRSNQDQIRGRLTLPHLTHCQAKSLDMPKNQSSAFQNMLHGFSNNSVNEMNQTKSLDISPAQTSEVNTTSENNSITSMPRPTISIHIRKPTVKSSIHGKQETLKIYLKVLF